MKADHWVVVKFINQKAWIFVRPNALKISKDNQKLSIDCNTAQQKGLNVRKLVNNELQKNLIKFNILFIFLL